MLVLLRVSLCPLWFKRLLSALISENQRQKGFDLLRASAPPWWVLFLGLVVSLLRCVLCGLKNFYQHLSAQISGKKGFDFLRSTDPEFLRFCVNFLLFSIKSFSATSAFLCGLCDELLVFGFPLCLSVSSVV